MMIKATGFNHVTLRISDLARSLPFYVDTLGMKLVHRGKTDVYLEWGTAWICLLEMPGVNKTGGPLTKPAAEQSEKSGVIADAGLDHFAFSIDEADFAGAVERLRSSDVPIVRGPDLRGGGWSINFLDPDGIQLELFTGTLAERMKNWN
ncbi:MAG: Glutathione transferase fosA [Paenibacillus sp.]|jgi:metallothiol transferase|nr:Glutathione transferase fosA [Paenibacillus sp.]